MDPVRSNRFVRAARGTGACLLVFVLIGLAAYFLTASYYGAACLTADRSNNEPFTIAMLEVLVMPVVIPPLGILWLALAVTIGIAGKPLDAGTRFWTRLGGVLAGVAGIAAMIFIVVRMLGIQERCYLSIIG